MTINQGHVQSEWLERIWSALEGLEYGSVVITVHDAKVVQIDRTEKFRFPLDRAAKQDGRTQINAASNK
jgi:hypothetical protein